MTELGEIQRTIGILLQGQRTAEQSRDELHLKIDKTDEFLDGITARLQDVAISLRLTNEIAVKVNNRLDLIEPVVKDMAQFKADSEPTIRIVKQLRLYVITIGILLGGLWTAGVVAYAYAGDVVRYAIRSWLGG